MTTLKAALEIIKTHLHPKFGVRVPEGDIEVFDVITALSEDNAKLRKALKTARIYCVGECLAEDLDKTLAETNPDRRMLP